MTISLRQVSAMDLFADNEIIEFDVARARNYCWPIPAMGALSFIATRGDPGDTWNAAIEASAQAAAALLYEHPILSLYRVWLVVAHGPWQPLSRIVKYNKLWKTHPELVPLLDSTSKHREEIQILSSEGVRFVGAISVNEASFSEAAAACRKNSAFSMVATHRHDIASESGLRALFDASFPRIKLIARTSIDWMNLALAFCPKDDLVIRVFGAFDDREGGIDLFASTILINRLLA